jgi:hypothetical protein
LPGERLDRKVPSVVPVWCVYPGKNRAEILS